MSGDLEGKRILVAGSSRGIGFAIAERFAEDGGGLILTGRTGTDLDDAQSRLQDKFGRPVTALRGDLSDQDQAREILAVADPVDIAVINFGATNTAAGFQTSDGEWDRLIAANLGGPFRLARHLATDMKDRGSGVLLFIGSIAGIEAIGAPIAYGAGKAGLRHAMKAMARELAPFGVRVNMISPGNILFDGGRWAWRRSKDPNAIDDLIERTVPLKRFGTVREVADAAAFLCSPEASFVVGTDLVVDGGQTTGF